MMGTLIALDSGSAGLDLGTAYTLGNGQPVKDVFSTPAQLVNLLVPNLFVIAGVAAMILAIVIGYKFLAKGSQGIQDAIKISIAGAAGIVVMFAAYWILQIIKQMTGADIPL